MQTLASVMPVASRRHDRHGLWRSRGHGRREELHSFASCGAQQIEFPRLSDTAKLEHEIFDLSVTAMKAAGVFYCVSLAASLKKVQKSIKKIWLCSPRIPEPSQ